MCVYDEELDRMSVNPGEHLYEKMIGNMFSHLCIWCDFFVLDFW